MQEKECGVPIMRIIAGVQERDLAATEAFHTDLIGLKVDMEEPDFLILNSETMPSAQLNVNDNGYSGLLPKFATDVGTPAELATVHDGAVRRGIPIVEPLADTVWGIRRFSMLDPDGTCTIICHIDG